MENGEREKERILLAGLVSHKSSNFIKREGPWAAIVKKWVSKLIPLEFNREGPFHHSLYPMYTLPLQFDISQV